MFNIHFYPYTSKHRKTSLKRALCRSGANTCSTQGIQSILYRYIFWLMFSVMSDFSDDDLVCILLHTWSFAQVTIIPLAGSCGHHLNTWKTEAQNWNASLFIHLVITIKISSTQVGCSHQSIHHFTPLFLTHVLGRLLVEEINSLNLISKKK